MTNESFHLKVFYMSHPFFSTARKKFKWTSGNIKPVKALTSHWKCETTTRQRNWPREKLLSHMEVCRGFVVVEALLDGSSAVTNNIESQWHKCTGKHQWMHNAPASINECTRYDTYVKHSRTCVTVSKSLLNTLLDEAQHIKSMSTLKAVDDGVICRNKNEGGGRNI